MPTATTNSAAPFFMGEFRHAIDGKSRLTVPSPWRFEEEAEFFLLPSSAGNCLKAMPRQEIERIRAQAALLPGAQRIEVLRALGSGSRQCRLDKAGRLVVPEEFCQALQLGGEVTLAGAIETFEIWNTAAWEQAKAKTEVIATPHLADFGL
jgi:MraZ protein